jgi:hypothetical protein
MDNKFVSMNMDVEIITFVLPKLLNDYPVGHYMTISGFVHRILGQVNISSS